MPTLRRQRAVILVPEKKRGEGSACKPAVK